MATDMKPDLYTGWRDTALGAITEAVEDRLLFRLAGEVAGRRVLDVGCGDGALAMELDRRGARVVGVDPSADMLEAAVARTRGHPIALAAAAGERLPFRDGSFDLVLAKTVLCFVPDAQAMMDEMARVLHLQGRLVIGELNRWSLWAAGRRLRAWAGSALWRRGRFRTAGEICRLARTAGLQVEAVRGAVYYPRLAWAARLMAPWDDGLAHLGTFGAAFVALAAIKPAGPPS